MYGLFKVTFDYYSWEDVVAVSDVMENLERHYKGLGVNYPLYGETRSDQIIEGRSEEYHYTIKKIPEV